MKEKVAIIIKNWDTHSHNVPSYNFIKNTTDEFRTVYAEIVSGAAFVAESEFNVNSNVKKDHRWKFEAGKYFNLA